MAKTSTLTITVQVTGDGVNDNWTPTPPQNTAAPGGGPQLLALASGDNTITVPAGASGFVLLPPAGSAVVKKIKGAGGDTGVTISNTLPFVGSVSAGSLIINASNVENVQIFWF